MEYQEFTRKAEKLLFSSEYDALQKALTIKKPNLWRILGVANRETRISRFLAWLLNPRANHTFGDLFLKEFLVQSLRADVGYKSILTPVEISLLDLSNAQIKTEYTFPNKRRCDIAIFTSAKTNTGFLCLIENKVWSRERDNQTIDYYNASLEEFPLTDYPHRIYIYLTPFDAPPQSENFIPLSYREVLQALYNFQEKYQVMETEQFLLQQFQDSIKGEIAMDDRTINLAQTIYEQHKDVIDFVVRVGSDNDDDDDGSGVLNRDWDGRSRFFNVGERGDETYKWSDCRQYGFICAGGWLRFRKKMEALNIGDKILAYVSKFGYVGVGTIIKQAAPFRKAQLADGTSFSEVSLEGIYNNNSSDDDDHCDWIALVKWQYVVEKDDAVRETPITVSTTCRIFEHRQDAVERIESELAHSTIASEITQ